MKTRNILLIVAVILILFNFLSYLSGTAKVPADNSVAYQTGYNFFFITGFIFLIVAFLIHRKENRKKKKEMVDSLFK